MKYVTKRQETELNGRWNFCFSNTNTNVEHTDINSILNSEMKTYPCTVPGNFELDLYDNDLIDHPYYKDNVLNLHKYEKYDIWYFRKFEINLDLKYDYTLIFNGLDCYADIFVNGKYLAGTDNMLIVHKLDITKYLTDGENEIIVHIKPSLIEAAKYDYPAYVRAHDFSYEQLYVRKAPHMYGWDIMPRILSAGMYREVLIQREPKDRIEEIYLPVTNISDDKNYADLVLHYDLNMDLRSQSLYELEYKMECGKSCVKSKFKTYFKAGKKNIQINNPKLWWPKGRGKQHLYRVMVTMYKDGKSVDTIEFKTGIRTVELKRTSTTDSFGNGEFVFKVNNEKVFVKGSNWVPADAFHSNDVNRIPKMLDLAEDLNCNMLRCWGGNVYENDLFYRICDEKGIMIWQDFALACAVYPLNDEFKKRISIEAENVIKRLRQHPCLVLWAGDNECDQAAGWGNIKTDPNANEITREVLPKAVLKNDPVRCFIPSSPYIDKGAYEKGSQYISENHLWGPRDYYKSKYYTNSICHFASEIGYHGCPSLESIKKFIPKDNVWPWQDNYYWKIHQVMPMPKYSKAYDSRIQLMANQIKELFGYIPDNPKDFVFASQATQGEAKKFFIELFRTQKWRRTGILWWNLIDGWPQFSDAVVDYYFDKKLAYHYIKRSQQDICVILSEPNSWKQDVLVCNDTKSDVDISISVTDVETNDKVFTRDITAKSDCVTKVGNLEFSNGDKRFFAIKWTGDKNGINHYLAGHPPFDLHRYRKMLKSFNKFTNNLMKD